jgi:hypothetical protein
MIERGEQRRPVASPRCTLCDHGHQSRGIDVGAEGDIVHVSLVRKSEDLLLRWHMPDTRGAIPACSGDPLPIGREARARYGAAMVQRRRRGFYLQEWFRRSPTCLRQTRFDAGIGGRNCTRQMRAAPRCVYVDTIGVQHLLRLLVELYIINWSSIVLECGN